MKDRQKRDSAARAANAYGPYLWSERRYGHPVSASALRMGYDLYTQLLGRGGERQFANPSLGLAHNLGGVPFQGGAAITILGLLS